MTGQLSLELFDGALLRRNAPLPSPTRPRTAADDERVPSREERLVLADQLARRLNAFIGQPVRLAVTDNRTTMVSYHRAERVIAIRLHHMFLDAPEHVVRAVATYAANGNKTAGRVLDEYIKAEQKRIRHARREGEALEPVGRCFHLKAIFDKLNAELFQDGIRARIGWARAPNKRRRKSIRLGVYEPGSREIRIHPALDSPDVPAYFVEYIVFHEMLHQLFPSARPDGRNVHHPRAFRDRERAYPHYEAALKWEKQHLKRLLRR